MSDQYKTPHDRFVEAVVAVGASPHPIFETGIPMRDGIELSADVYLPTASELPAPAVVTITPYDKSGTLVAPEARLNHLPCLASQGAIRCARPARASS